MERLKSKRAMLLLWAAFLSQNLLIPVMSAANFEDQKNYYPPSGSYTPPSHGSGGGHATPTPSHGGGSGSYGGSPPANCGTPPSGRHHRTSPSTPSGGGGYYHSPPISTPSPTTPTTPIPGSGTSPTTPIVNPPIVTPPIVDPGTPTTPGATIPSPPFSFGPSSPPFTCIFWRNHPTLVWGLIGWIGTVGGTVGGTLGVPTAPGFSPSTNVLQALSNTRTDGYGELYREGTAAFLNSIAHTRFPYTTTQVKDSFIAALSSNKAASAQAKLFKQANEDRTQPRV
ncbi:hypothetical protein F511_00282 [Dorcoceras hygrometricum]|nr:hypothetical protein F511_00282 [Dorcoceras hygrometricum]